MDYELYLRARFPTPAGAQALRRAVEAEASGPPAPEALGGRLELTDGVLEARLHPARLRFWQRVPEGEGYGVDLRVPGGANPALARAAVARAFEWADQHALTVYDPQLGRPVRPRDADAITARVARLAEYLTETVGMDEGQAEARIAVEPRRPPLPLRTRFYLALAAALVLLAVLSRYC